MSIFLNSKHHGNYAAILERLQGMVAQNDKERMALFYILAGNEDLYSKINSVYDFDNNWINLDCFEHADFSSSSKALVRLGFNLYNSYKDEYTSPIDVLCDLDEKNFKLAINAIQLRFNMIAIE